MSVFPAEVASGPRVRNVRSLTESTYVLRFDRGEMEFTPGQYVAVGVRGEIDMREYSIYSSPDDAFLEILVKEVDGGHVSRALRRIEPGGELAVDGPFGFFLIDEEVRARAPVLFIATGTGISPFHCFAAAYRDLDYRLVHGVRRLEERYDYGVFDPRRVTTCVSREPLDGRSAGTQSESRIVAGRVTDFLLANPVPANTYCYLCGNCDMIYDSFDILKQHGVPPEQLFAEVYF